MVPPAARNHGWIFLGSRANRGCSDKGVTGTSHVQLAGHAARYTGGLSGRALLRRLSYQRIEDDRGTNPMAEAVVASSPAEGLCRGWRHGSQANA